MDVAMAAETSAEHAKTSEQNFIVLLVVKVSQDSQSDAGSLCTSAAISCIQVILAGSSAKCSR
jgi:hypothetical protein